MDFEIPADVAALLDELDDFIERVVRPIQDADDNDRFFDHRREDARTDWERGGLPNDEWEALLHRVKRLADEAGLYRYPLSKEYGGRDGTNLGMAIVREHLARKGLGLFNDLQNEHSIVGNNVGLLLMIECSFCRSLNSPNPLRARCSRTIAMPKLVPSRPPYSLDRG